MPGKICDTSLSFSTCSASPFRKEQCRSTTGFVGVRDNYDRQTSALLGTFENGGEISAEGKVFTTKGKIWMEERIRELETGNAEKETDRQNNKNTIDSLKTDLEAHDQNTDNVDYGAGLQRCIDETPDHATAAEACYSAEASSLQKRNESCSLLKRSTEKTDTINGQGWAQCTCRNGTLGDDHRACAPGESQCSACDSRHWMRIGEYSYFDELYRNEHPKEDSSIQCVNLDVDPKAGHGPCLEKCRQNEDCNEVWAYDADHPSAPGRCCLKRFSFTESGLTTNTGGSYYRKVGQRFQYKGTFGGYEFPTKEDAEKMCESEGYTLCKKEDVVRGAKQTPALQNVCTSGWTKDEEGPGWFSVIAKDGCGANNTWNTWSPIVKCAAHYSSTIPSDGSSGAVAAAHVCPESYPMCEGYEKDVQWGKCSKMQRRQGASAHCCKDLVQKGINNSCEALTACDKNEYIHSPSSSTKNLFCAPLTECGIDEYESKSPDENTNRVCEKLAVCTDDQYESVSPGNHPYKQNRVCENLTVCTDDQYESMSPGITPPYKKNRECKNYDLNCNTYQRIVGRSRTSNGRCENNVCRCANGIASADCSQHNAFSCKMCYWGYKLRNGRCWREENNTGYYEN